jgi:MSHA biogenesis protein MshG
MFAYKIFPSLETPSIYQFLEALLPYLKASIPLCEAITLTGKQQTSLKKTSEKIGPLIRRGHSLSLAIEASGVLQKTSTNELIQWIALGEETGELTVGIESALILFKAKRLSQKTWLGILRYPVMILSFMIMAIFILNQTTLPALKKFYGEKPLPEVSSLIFNHPLWVSGFLLLTPLVLSYFLWPFKKLQNQISLCQKLALKLQAGIPLLHASPKNWRDLISRGTPLSIVLEIKNQDLFLIQMAKLGEKTGNLAQSFQQAQKFYQAKLDLYLERLQAYLPSALMLLMGVFVAVLVSAIYLPMVQMDFS